MSTAEELGGPVFEVKEIGKLNGLVIGYNMETSRFQLLDPVNGRITQGFRTVLDLKKAKAHSRIRWVSIVLEDVGTKN